MKRDDNFKALFYSQNNLRHIVVSREGEQLVLLSLNILSAPIRYALSAKTALQLAEGLTAMIPGRKEVGDKAEFSIMEEGGKLRLNVGLTEEPAPKVFFEVVNNETQVIEDVMVHPLNVGFTIREAIAQWFAGNVDLAV